MAERTIEQLTLREMLFEAERLTREMNEHLQQGFLPKARDLRRLVKQQNANAENVKDITVRTNVARVLESEEFTRGLLEKMEEYFAGIDNALSELRSGNENESDSGI